MPLVRSATHALMPALLVSVAVAPLGGCGDEYAPGQPSDGVVGLRALREGLAALEDAAETAARAAAVKTEAAQLLAKSAARRTWLGEAVTDEEAIYSQTSSATSVEPEPGRAKRKES
jgi:hypothetical protein